MSTESDIASVVLHNRSRRKCINIAQMCVIVLLSFSVVFLAVRLENTSSALELVRVEQLNRTPAIHSALECKKNHIHAKL